jgi:simple sugar transport system permease protein
MPFLAGGELFGWRSPDMLGWLEERHWFVIGDAAGIVRGVVFNLSWASVIGIVLVFVSAYVLWRTRFGLRLRSSGEAPTAAESLGVRIVRLRYVGLLISGSFAGLGGAYLSIVLSSYYREGQTANRGYIGLATTIFGNWRPIGVLGGATLFGFSDAIKLLSPKSLPALFLFGTFIAGLVVIADLLRKRTVTAITAAIVGALFLAVFLSVDEVPDSLAQSTPYVVTLVVLAVASQRLRPPAHAGIPWRPGDAH